MTRSVSFEASFTPWIFLTGLAILVAALSVVSTQLSVDVPRTLTKTGWCCPKIGTEKCIGKTDPYSCADHGGFAFARQESLCSFVCASSPPTNAVSTGSAR